MKIYNIIFLFTAFILVLSCEKVIDIDLNEANAKPVVEANIEEGHFCQAKLSWTSSFYDNSSSPAIENAIVSIKDDQGNIEVLQHNGQGLYNGSTLKGKADRTYTLTAQIEDQTYTASSYLPAVVALDSISFVELDGNFGPPQEPGAPQQYLTFGHLTDPAERVNYYRMNYYSRLPEPSAGFSTLDDGLTNGNPMQAFIRFPGFDEGDTIQIDLLSIDEGVHTYFESLDEALSSGGISSATPFNPISNFEGDVLGYFGAWSKSSLTLVLPK